MKIYDFYTVFIIPLAMIIAGFFMYKFPPKDINSMCGYRTKRSRSSKEAWDYAQILCGKIWLILGIVMLVVTLIIINVVQNKMTIIINAIQLIIFVCTMIPVESKLKQKFGV